MSIYFLSEAKTNDAHAGSKARNDVEIILNEKGYIPVPLYNGGNRFKILFTMLEILNKTTSNDYIVIQYPMLQGYNFWLKFLSRLRKVIVIVHDLPVLRVQGNSKRDIKSLVNVNYIISHNKYMSNYLVRNGINKDKIYNLNLFDYLVDINGLELKEYTNELCFAGNLEKSNFIYSLPKEVINLGIALYGVGYNENRGKKLNYMGSYNPNEIIQHLDGKYGLIWDGDSCETCAGNFGEYMKYNNPHKLSMYIAAGIPVVVWSEAAVADFVNTNKIGISVSSLDNLDKTLNSIDDVEYNEMKKNVINLRNKVIDGQFLKKQLNAIEEKIK